MLDEFGIAKYADFGASKILESDDIFEDHVGSYTFLAPECFKEGTYSAKKADIWALGVTLFALTYNTLPYFGKSDPEIQKAIIENELVLPDTRDACEGLKEWIKMVLAKDPE